MNMKKMAILVSIMVATLSTTACTTTKTVSHSDADGNTTTTTEIQDQNGTTIITENTNSDNNVIVHEETLDTVDASINDSSDNKDSEEIEYQVVESSDGYTVTFNPDWFIYDNSGEYEGKDSVYIRCTIDEENEYENYIDVETVEGYDAKELIEGIAFQSETEAIPMHILLANGEYDGYYCERHISDTFIISFYSIDGKDAPYLIEVGSHIYGDDDEYAYPVAGAMEEAFLDLKFEI